MNRCQWAPANPETRESSCHFMEQELWGRQIQIIQKGTTLWILIMQGRLAVTRSLFCNLFLRLWRTNRCRERSREEECKSGISHSWSFIHAKFDSFWIVECIDKIERWDDGMKGLKNEEEGEGEQSYFYSLVLSGSEHSPIWQRHWTHWLKWGLTPHQLFSQLISISLTIFQARNKI